MHMPPSLRTICAFVLMAQIAHQGDPSVRALPQEQARPTSPVTHSPAPRVLPAGATTTRSAEIPPSLTSLPLAFEGNRGQMPPAIRFRATTLGGILHFFAWGVHLTLPAKEGREAESLSLVFDHPDPGLEVVAGRLGDGRFNYIQGNDPSRWITGIRPAASIVYRGILPGVDLVYEGDQRRLKGTWKLAAGIPPETISWHYAGHRGLRVLADGSLEIELGRNTIVEEAPIAWQVDEGRRIPVACGFEIRRDGRVGFRVEGHDPEKPLVIDPRLSWATFIGGAGTDIIHALDVDDQGNVYITGYIHSTAEIPLLAPGSLQPFQPCYGGEIGDAFVMKIQHDLSPPRLVYSTRLGGGRLQRCSGTKICSDTPTVNPTCFSELIPLLDQPSAGTSPSYAWFPSGGVPPAVTASLYPYPEPAPWTPQPPHEALLARGQDRGLGIAVDRNTHEVVVVGWTQADDFPGTGSLAAPNLAVSHNLAGAPPSSYPGNQTDCHPAFQPNIGSDYAGLCPPANLEDMNDAFVARLSANGDKLIFGSYFGGLYVDEAHDVAVDSQGNAYVVGFSRPDPAFDISSLSGAQPFPGGGDLDAFILKVSPQGALLGATWLGGSHTDAGIGIDIGPAWDDPNAPELVYVTGTTFSLAGSNDLLQVSGAKSTNPLQPFYGGQTLDLQTIVNGDKVFFGDIFVGRLTTDLRTIEYLTYLDSAVVTSGTQGSSSDEWATAIKVDEHADVYVSGVVVPVIDQGFAVIMKLHLSEAGPADLLGAQSYFGEQVIWPYDLDVNRDFVAIAGTVGTKPYLTMPTQFPITGFFIRDKICTNGVTSLRYFDGSASAVETTPDGVDGFVAVFSKEDLQLKFASYIGGEAPSAATCASGCGQPIPPVSREIFQGIRFDGNALLVGGFAGKTISTAPRINALFETSLWNGAPPGTPCTAGSFSYTFPSTYDGSAYACNGSADMYLIRIDL